MRKLILILAAVLVASSAAAQPERLAARKPLTGNIVNDIRQRTDATDAGQGAGGPTDRAGRQKIMQMLAKPFQDLADFIGEDAEDAIALSTSIPGMADGHGQQCWIAARNFTAVIKAHPLPLTGGAMRDLEGLRLLNIAAKRLCEDSHCTQVFTDLKNAAITIAQTGFGAIGATAVRGVPGLQDVCTQIPNVPLADPLLPVPPAPVVKPVGLGDGTPTPIDQTIPVPAKP